MRHTHRAGEKGFVDWAGQTIPIIDPVTGAAAPAQLFVDVLGASNPDALRGPARGILNPPRKESGGPWWAHAAARLPSTDVQSELNGTQRSLSPKASVSEPV